MGQQREIQNHASLLVQLSTIKSSVLYNFRLEHSSDDWIDSQHWCLFVGYQVSATLTSSSFRPSVSPADVLFCLPNPLRFPSTFVPPPSFLSLCLPCPVARLLSWIGSSTHKWNMTMKSHKYCPLPTYAAPRALDGHGPSLPPFLP